MNYYLSEINLNKTCVFIFMEGTKNEIHNTQSIPFLKTHSDTL